MLFHEYGHAVDYLTGNRSAELNDYIDADAESYLYYLANSIPGYTDAEREDAVKRFMKGEKSDPNDTSAAGKLQYLIYQDLIRAYGGHSNNNILDVFGGATKNAAIKDTEGNGPTGGHSDDYWGSQAFWSELAQGSGLGPFIPEISPGLEQFAHSFSDGMTNNTQNKNDTKDMLPSTSDAVDDIMDDIYEKAKERIGRP